MKAFKSKGILFIFALPPYLFVFVFCFVLFVCFLFVCFWGGVVMLLFFLFVVGFFFFFFFFLGGRGCYYLLRITLAQRLAPRRVPKLMSDNFYVQRVGLIVLTPVQPVAIWRPKRESNISLRRSRVLCLLSFRS